MILVTGGAGFIGSNLVASLLESKRKFPEIVVCDEFGDGDKWRNLAKHEVSEIIPPFALMDWLEANKDKLEIIFHLGAISSTTEKDVDLILENNFMLSLQLWKWCAENKVRFIYASSGSTYGDGKQGFDDDSSTDYLSRLRPLNPYGWSKHLFDQRIMRLVEQGISPPQWVGLKFFNVYGPNEFHKGSQMSVLCRVFPHAQKNLPVKLFKSENSAFPHGDQRRDFIYVRDCADVMLWLAENPKVSGIFNVGTGQARTFNDLAACMFKSLGHGSPRIDYIDMPVEIVDKYQYVTEAKMDRLREAGYTKAFTTLEAGTADYINSYLLKEDPYR